MLVQWNFKFFIEWPTFWLKKRALKTLCLIWMHVRKLVCRQSHDDWDKMTKRLISHMICVYIEGKKWATHASMWFWAFRLKKKIHFMCSFCSLDKRKIEHGWSFWRNKKIRCKQSGFYYVRSHCWGASCCCFSWSHFDHFIGKNGFTSWPWWELSHMVCRSKSYFSAFIHSFICPIFQWLFHGIKRFPQIFLFSSKMKFMYPNINYYFGNVWKIP